MTHLSVEDWIDDKSTYLLDHHGAKVKELYSWLRVAKMTTLLLIFSILVNLVLMYGLIHYPCSPSAVRCNKYYAAMEIPQILQLPSLTEDSKLMPTSSVLVSSEVAVRSSGLVIRDIEAKVTKNLAIRSTESTYHYYKQVRIVLMPG
jgi:hypothetical protein